MHGRKGKFSTSHQQAMPSTSAVLWLLRKANIITANLHPCPPLFSAFVSEQTSHGMEHLFGQTGPVSLAVSSPRIVPTLRLLMRRNVGEPFLVLCQPCPAAAPALVCSQHLSSHHSKAQTLRAAVGKIKSISDRLSTDAP